MDLEATGPIRQVGDESELSKYKQGFSNPAVDKILAEEKVGFEDSAQEIAILESKESSILNLTEAEELL